MMKIAEQLRGGMGRAKSFFAMNDHDRSIFMMRQAGNERRRWFWRDGYCPRPSIEIFIGGTRGREQIEKNCSFPRDSRPVSRHDRD